MEIYTEADSARFDMDSGSKTPLYLCWGIFGHMEEWKAKGGFKVRVQKQSFNQ